MHSTMFPLRLAVALHMGLLLSTTAGGLSASIMSFKASQPASAIRSVDSPTASSLHEHLEAANRATDEEIVPLYTPPELVAVATSRAHPPPLPRGPRQCTSGAAGVPVDRPHCLDVRRPIGGGVADSCWRRLRWAPALPAADATAAGGTLFRGGEDGSVCGCARRSGWWVGGWGVAAARGGADHRTRVHCRTHPHRAAAAVRHPWHRPPPRLRPRVPRYGGGAAAGGCRRRCRRRDDGWRREAGGGGGERRGGGGRPARASSRTAKSWHAPAAAAPAAARRRHTRPAVGRRVRAPPARRPSVGGGPPATARRAAAAAAASVAAAPPPPPPLTH